MKIQIKTRIPIIKPEVCTGCAECLPTCALDGLVIVDDVARIKKPAICMNCSACTAYCRYDAMRYMILA